MSQLQIILDALRSAGSKVNKTTNGFECNCPAHDDKDPSLSVSTGEDNCVLLNCHAGCTAKEIVSALGLTLADFYEPRNRQQRQSTLPTRSKPQMPSIPRIKPRAYDSAEAAIEACEAHLGHKHSKRWPYHNAAGDVVGYVVRWDKADGGKTFRPISLVDSAWCRAGMPSPTPLYRLPELAGALTVYVVEGEKCADAARACGFTATTSAHGSKSAVKADWSPLAGKDVVIVPDRDDAGSAYADNVSRLVQDVGARSVRIINLADHWKDLPKGGDIADALELEEGDADRVRAAVESLATSAEPLIAEEAGADSIHPLRERGGRIEYSIVPISELGPAKDPDWLWPGYIARGAMTLFTGLWKAGKTTLLKHLIRDLTRGTGLADAPIDSPILILSEEPTSIWAERRESLELTDNILFLRRPSFARPNRHEWLDLIDYVVESVRERGIGLVVFDTLPSFWFVQNENDASETIEALTPLRDLTEAGAAVLLVAHPRKSDGQQGTATRGSGALTGFVDVIVELRRHDPNNFTDTRRNLEAYGRYDATPDEMVVELGEDGYTMLGDRVDVHSADTLNTIRNLLPAGGEGLTAEDVREQWPTAPTPGKTGLSAKLKAGAKRGLWIKNGEGVKGNPFRYRREEPSQDSIRPGLSLRGRIELGGDKTIDGEGDSCPA